MSLAQVAAAMPERQLQDEVRSICGTLGLAVQHIEDARRAWLVGWPDLTILGHNRVLWRELKRMGEDPTSDQRRVGYIIQAAGGDWDTWRPIDLLTGRIARELTAISRLAIAPHFQEAAQ